MIPITNIPELDNLNWKEKVVQGKNNRQYHLLEAQATEGFWELRNRYQTILEGCGIKLSKYGGKWLISWWMNRQGSYSVPVLPKVEVMMPLEVEPLENEENVKDFQIYPVQAVVASMKHNGYCLNGCGTGVGKTFITLAAARELGVNLIVICPKTIVSDWKWAANLMGVKIEAYGWEWIKTSKTPFGKWADKNKYEFEWNLPDRAYLVLDECHRAANPKTQNTKIVISAKNQAIPTFMLSATIANDPTKMRAVGYMLGLHKDGMDYFEWMKRHGVKQVQVPIPGKKKDDRPHYDDEEDSGYDKKIRKIKIWKFSGNANDLQNIHKAIFPRKGVRVTAEQLGDKFPSTQIIAKAYDMDEWQEIQSTYDDLEFAIEEIYQTVPRESRQASILAERVKARMKIEMLKIPLFVLLTKDAIEEGNSVFIAVNFKQTLRELQRLLKITAVVKGLESGYNEFDRKDAINAFQSNDVKIIAGIIPACREGISLHDVLGGHPRLALISPTDNAFDLKQVLGRVPRVGGTPSIQRILFAAKTIEEKVVVNLATKLDQLDLLMDGDLTKGVFPEYSEMRK